MKHIIFKQYKGGKPAEYAKVRTLKEAKEILHNKYLAAIEFLNDEIIVGRDELTDRGRTLDLFEHRYWIEQDKSL